jgi:dihydropteroate synthase
MSSLSLVPSILRPSGASRYDDSVEGREDAFVWRCGPFVLDCRTRTHVMGILNVTPDSFSDGGRFADPDRAAARGVEMAEEGADIIDVGGESTRPHADPVGLEEELERVIPVVKRLAAELEVPVSIDTRKHDVARAALEAGASIVNDVSAGGDPAMFGEVARAGAGMVLMHMRGDPATMNDLTEYRDVVADVGRYLDERVTQAVDQGIEWDRLAVDPGLGFAKTSDQSLVLMREIGSFASLGRPVLVGPSRKSFVGNVLGTEADDRLEGTAGAVAWLVANGAHVVRVHDVQPMVRVVRMVDAIRRGTVAE